MKVSLNWIRRYVDLPDGLSTDQLSHDLTMRTVEVEGAVNPADGLSGVVLGIINDITPIRRRICFGCAWLTSGRATRPPSYAADRTSMWG